MNIKSGLLSFLVIGLGPLASGDVVRVDFGTATSPLRPGFLCVTDRTEFKDGVGVGWIGTTGLSSHDVPIARDWKMNPSRGEMQPPPIYTTDLREDYVEGTSPASLRIRAPDGRYRVWLLCGSAGGARPRHRSLGAGEPRRATDADGENPSLVWDVTVDGGLSGCSATFLAEFACRVLEFPAVARNGAIDIRFSTRSRWLANAMLIAPEADYPALKKGELAKIEQEIFLLPDDVLKDWKFTPHVEAAPLPEFTAAEKTRGFVVYTRNWASPIWPNTSPRREEIDPTLRAFAARDEYEPVNFAIYPLRDFDAVDVEVDDLATSDGRKIPRRDIDIRYVRYVYSRPNYNAHGTYLRIPDALMPLRGARPLVKNENFRVWMTVHAAADAAPGLYRGRAAVRAAGQPIAEVPIEFRVLPLNLQKDESIGFGLYYNHPYDFMSPRTDAFSQEWWRRKAEREFADMAAHGQNTVLFQGGIGARFDAAGRWIIDFDSFQRKLDLARHYGFNRPYVIHLSAIAQAYRKHLGAEADMGAHLRLLKMPPAGFFDDVTELVRAIEAERKRRHWPEFVYYPIDEPGREAKKGDASSEADKIQFVIDVMKAIKRVPGVRTYATADPAWTPFAPMKPYVDIWCSQPFSLPRETVFADMQARPGLEYWCYPNPVNGASNHTPVAGARMTYGFGLWRSGYRALVPWIYQAVVSDQWNYLDSHSMDHFNRTDDDGSPIPVVLWEAYREGIDDGRYVTTLERWIAKARAIGRGQAADEAAAELKSIWDAIAVQPLYQYDVPWTDDAFDGHRWSIARRIMQLQEIVDHPAP